MAFMLPPAGAVIKWRGRRAEIMRYDHVRDEAHVTWLDTKKRGIISGQLFADGEIDVEERR